MRTTRFWNNLHSGTLKIERLESQIIYCHDITEILLKVALNTIKPTKFKVLVVIKPKGLVDRIDKIGYGPLHLNTYSLSRKNNVVIGVKYTFK